MGRSLVVISNVKKGPWSPEEDDKLKEFIEKYGTGGNWIAFPQKVGSIAKSKEIKDIRFKFKNDPIRLGEISAKSKQSEIVEGGDKDQYDTSSSKKRKGKAIVY
ncbi:hypothetical protein MTR67_029171 [Solanum verrucosum]|uniref:Myb-like domain-containing protein n=1 Tax=Solanum verrucosum TaxID=315347 RepID=A0AAF0RCA3_SOLVR|nr:hypothetical protein MTR67_029171 [Solanum verrucosum]